MSKREKDVFDRVRDNRMFPFEAYVALWERFTGEPLRKSAGKCPADKDSEQ